MSFGAQLGSSFENFGFADIYPSRKTLPSHSFEGTIFLLRDVLKVSTCFFLDLNMLNPMSFNAWKLEMNPRRAGKTGFFRYFFRKIFR